MIATGPNKIFVLEFKGGLSYTKASHFVIVVAASSAEVAREYVKNKVGIDSEPTWLMNAVYPTIYTSDGSIAEPIQAKILYNGNFHVVD